MYSRRVRNRLLISLGMLAVITMGGVSGFMALEGLSFSDAFYLMIISLSTVGYGDIHPVTGEGKILATVVIILGVGSFMGVIANTAELIWSRNEERIRHQKLSMVMGVFFTEVGTELLKLLARSDADLEETRGHLLVNNDWSPREFEDRKKWVTSHDFRIRPEIDELKRANSVLANKRDLLARLMENPNLLENESFADLLWAILHIREECKSRLDLDHLDAEHLEHLAVDVKRAYVLLIDKWLDYMKHLEKRFPHLFKLAVVQNPFVEQ